MNTGRAFLGQFLYSSSRIPSVENGSFRLKPHISGFLHINSGNIVCSGLSFFRLSDSTGRSSRKSQSKTCFLNPSHRPSHHKKHPHAHTPIPDTKYHTAVSYNSADSGLAAITAAASRRKSAWRIPMIAPPAGSVYHTMAAARGIDVILQQRLRPL